MTEHVPMPLEWHPAYADATWMLDWLNGEGAYADRYVIQYPKQHGSAATWMTGDEQFPTAALPKPLVLTKRKCAGPAPYVGRPFHYVWFAAEDDAHRWVAGEARMEWITDEITWMFGLDGGTT